VAVLEAVARVVLDEDGYAAFMEQLEARAAEHCGDVAERERRFQEKMDRRHGRASLSSRAQRPTSHPQFRHIDIFSAKIGVRFFLRNAPNDQPAAVPDNRPAALVVC
jgi:hypothetical protein